MLDFMLFKRRNKAAATNFFTRALEVDGLPRKTIFDKSGANTAGIKAINMMLKSSGCPLPIEMVKMIGKGQFMPELSPLQQFGQLAE